MSAKRASASGAAGTDVLVSASRVVSVAEAESIARDHYGLRGTATRLAGEKDENFRIDDAGGVRHFLKIAHAAESARTTNLTTCALLHVEQEAPELPVQRVIRTLEGLPEQRLDGDGRTARVTSYLDGTILRGSPTTVALREAVGVTAATLGQALRGFAHQGAERELLWDLAHADRVAPMADGVDDTADRELLQSCFARFLAVVAPALASLRAQVVHNDLSGDNLLVDANTQRIVGIIDFGDVTRTPLVSDLAIAAANQLGDGDDPFGPALDVVRGYHGVVPLTAAERAVLYDLVRTRLAVHIAITEWRAARFPANREYIARKTPRAWSLLRRLPETAAASATQRIAEVTPDAPKGSVSA
jgi:hydroxylysine kinase